MRNGLQKYRTGSNLHQNVPDRYSVYIVGVNSTERSNEFSGNFRETYVVTQIAPPMAPMKQFISIFNAVVSATLSVEPVSYKKYNEVKF